MIQKSDITFLIPIFNLKKDRLENFIFVVNAIKKITDSILVVEQVRSKNARSIAKTIANSLNIDYLPIQIVSKNIHKSKLINIGTDHISTPYVWVNDADCYLKYEEIISSLANIDKEISFIQPYIAAKNTTKEQAKQIIKNIPTEINFKNLNRGSDPTESISLYGALSFIFKKTEFCNIGKMDESFIGYGYEDNDLCYRIFTSEHFTKFKIIESYGIHLWHEINHPNINNNKDTLCSKHNKILDDINIELGKRYRDAIYNNIEIVTLLRGDLQFLENISQFLLREIPTLNSLPKITWVINSDNEDFIVAAKNKSKLFGSNIELIFKSDIGGHNPLIYLDSNIHSQIAQIYEDIFRATNSDILITLEDDIVPPEGALKKLYTDFCSFSFKDLGAIGCLYEDRGCSLNGLPGTVCGVNMKDRRDAIDMIKNSGTIPYLRIPGGFTAYDTRIVKKCLPLNVFNRELIGWDWKISRDMIDNNIQLYINTDIICEHLI